MVGYCVAFNCKNKEGSKNNTRITFHRFPFSRPTLLGAWIKAVRRAKWHPTKHSRLCSYHFTDDQYQIRPGAATNRFSSTSTTTNQKKRVLICKTQACDTVTSINMNHISTESRTVQVVRSEPRLAVREIVDDDWRDINELQRKESATTSSTIYNVNLSANGDELGDALDMKREIADVNIVLQRRDVLSGTHQLNINVAGQIYTINHDHNYHAPLGEVKEEIVEDECGDSQHRHKETQPEQHTQLLLHTCVVCLKTSETAQSLSAHCSHAHGKGSHRCIQCNEEYKSRAYLLEHVRKAHSKQQNQCIVRKEELKSEKGSRKQTSTRRDPQAGNEEATPRQRPHSKLYSCDKCFKVLNSKSSFFAHRKYVHSTESHKCTQCGKEFRCEFYLYNHVRYAHSDDRQECEICKEICKSSRALSTHYSKYHGPKSAVSYTCDYCQRTYQAKQRLIVHIESVHCDNVHICSECNKIFRAEHHMALHIRRTHLEISKRRKHPLNTARRVRRKKSTALENQRPDQAQAMSTPSIVIGVDEAVGGADLGDELAIKQESEDTDLDIGPTVLQHMDSDYAFKQVKTENSPLQNELIVKTEPDLYIKEDIGGVCD